MTITSTAIEWASTVEDEVRNYLISQPEALRVKQIEQNALFGCSQTPQVIKHLVSNSYYLGSVTS